MALFYSTNVVLLFVPTSRAVQRGVEQNRQESKDRFVPAVLLLLMLAVGLYGEILRHVS